MRARLLGMLVALAVPASLVAAPAEAKPGYEVQERALRLAVQLEAADGYEATIETEGHRRVTLTVRRGFSAVAYRTAGRVTRRGIEARFGDLGRVSVRFDGERRPFPSLLPPGLRSEFDGPGPSTPRCFGRKPVREAGVFRGSILFEGENGFARIRAQRARGEVERFYTRVCERSPLGNGPGGPKLPGALSDFKVSVFYAAEDSEGRKASFEAVGFEFGLPGAPAGQFFAANAKVLERREGMAIARVGVALLDEGSMIASRPGKSPVTVTVALPPPFSGTADYRKDHGAPAAWSGSLALRSLGGGLVPLTGPGFSAALCRVALTELFTSPCLRRAGVPLPKPARRGPAIGAGASALERALAQGSGSQSQFFWDARLPWSR